MKKILISTLALIISMLGLGFVVTNTADATPDKPWICHPVEGKGETGYGWNLINPNKASSHIDESTGAGKHTRKDGRTDVYATADMKCPGAPTDPTTEPTDNPTTDVPTDNPTTDTPTENPVTFIDPHWTIKIKCLEATINWIVPTPSDNYTFSVAPAGGRSYDITFVANEGYAFNQSDRYTVSDDGGRAVVRVWTPVVRCVVPHDEPEIGTPVTETRCSPKKCVKITRDGSGKVVDRDVTDYGNDVVEEGL